ncbi:MAG: SPFH domain-containing protein [Acidobacteria bacterium]|nr:SPFH domain-containing protein [Acidobacteriota bacterium]
MPFFWLLVIAVAVLVALAAAAAFYRFKNYRKAGPNQVLVISGRPSTVTDTEGRTRTVGYRLQIGGGTFVRPLAETVDILPLEVFSISVKAPDVITSQGVLISADAQAQVKVSSEEGDLHRAVENFLSRGASGITYVAQEVLEGHLRSVLGGMTVEEIYTGREEVAERLRRQADPDFRRLGLELVSFSLKDVADAQGYIAAIGARRLAEIKRDAAIAQAETERDAAINAAEARKEGDVARLRAEAELAEATRDFEMRRADYQAAVNTKRAHADLAYDLERAKGELVLRQEEYRVRLTEKELAAKVEQAEVIRREQELEANVKRPAEAMQFQARLEAETDGASQAEAIAAKGKAEAEAMRQKAEAFKQYSEAALAEMVVKVLPELARNVSEPLSKVEKIVMVGDDAGVPKITGQVAQVVAQLPTVVEALTGLKLADLIKKKP